MDQGVNQGVNQEVDYNCSINLGGVPQWIYVRGKNRKNPVLLFLHSGPGFCESQFAYVYGSVLEPHYTVVHWDQRGVNRSFSEKISRESMTMEQFQSDAIELIQYLRKEFQKEKIVIVGHSFGTMLSLFVISKVPELVSYYFGLGQTVGGTRGDMNSYNTSIAKAKNDGLTDQLQDLESLGTPPYDQMTDNLYSAIKWMMGGNFGKKFMDLAKVISSGPASYRPVVEFRKMNSFTEECLHSELEAWEVRKHVSEILVPVCLVSGTEDLMTPPSQAEELMQSTIFKNKKEFFVFDDCAHWPHHEYPEKILALFRERIVSGS